MIMAQGKLIEVLQSQINSQNDKFKMIAKLMMNGFSGMSSRVTKVEQACKASYALSDEVGKTFATIADAPLHPTLLGFIESKNKGVIPATSNYPTETLSLSGGINSSDIIQMHAERKECLGRASNRYLKRQRGLEEAFGMQNEFADEAVENAQRVRERLENWHETLLAQAATIDGLGRVQSATQGELQKLAGSLPTSQELENLFIRHDEMQASKLQVIRLDLSNTSNRVEHLETALAAAVDGTQSFAESHVKLAETRLEKLLAKEYGPLASGLNDLTQRLEVAERINEDQGGKLESLAEVLEENRIMASEGKTVATNVKSGLLTEEAQRIHDFKEIKMAIKLLSKAQQTGNQALTSRLECELDLTSKSLLRLSKAVDALHLDDEDLKSSMHHIDKRLSNWLDSEMLPARVSEARIFAAEARLREEEVSRLKLENFTCHMLASLADSAKVKTEGLEDILHDTIQRSLHALPAPTDKTALSHFESSISPYRNAQGSNITANSPLKVGKSRFIVGRDRKNPNGVLMGRPKSHFNIFKENLMDEALNIHDSHKQNLSNSPEPSKSVLKVVKNSVNNSAALPTDNNQNISYNENNQFLPPLSGRTRAISLRNELESERAMKTKLIRSVGTGQTLSTTQGIGATGKWLQKGGGVSPRVRLMAAQDGIELRVRRGSVTALDELRLAVDESLSGASPDADDGMN